MFILTNRMECEGRDFRPGSLWEPTEDYKYCEETNTQYITLRRVNGTGKHYVFTKEQFKQMFTKVGL